MKFTADGFSVVLCTTYTTSFEVFNAWVCININSLFACVSKNSYLYFSMHQKALIKRKWKSGNNKTTHSVDLQSQCHACEREFFHSRITPNAICFSINKFSQLNDSIMWKMSVAVMWKMSVSLVACLFLFI